MLDELRLFLSALLSKLFERNATVKFCDPALWISQDVPMGDEILRLIRPSDFDEDDKDAIDTSANSHVERKVVDLLCHLPIVVPFEKRALVFRQLVLNSQQFLQISLQTIQVRRECIFEDCFQQLRNRMRSIRGFRVQIKNEFGEMEAGIDGGGLMREITMICIVEGFDPNSKLFKSTVEHNLYPDPAAMLHVEDALARFEFLGFLLGNGLMQSMLVNVPFARFFLTKLLGQNPLLHELQSLDPEMYRHLLMLRDSHSQVNVEDLDLLFTITDASGKVVPLVPNGNHIQVTQENRLTYIYHVANYRLNTQIHRACQAFKTGLFSVISPAWIRMFDAAELQMLISGTSGDVDLDDFEAHTHYLGEYHPKHENILRFWRVVRAFDQKNVQALVQFVTSSPRAPLFGFVYFEPNIGIHCSGYEDRLPMAGTCFNMLKLPVYKDDETMRQRLLYAINSKAGFDLS
jgi:ubiquitin-protein ligase E3 C